MQNEIKKLNEMINSSKRIVFFGGAGVSTESGIPDFRSSDGIFSVYKGKNIPPEMIVSRSFFDRYPDEFFNFYKDRMIYEEAKPNAAHLKLAEMEKAGKLSAIITQNIDGLHTKAGSKNVYELHGSTSRNYCVDCYKEYSTKEILDQKNDIPRCYECGGIIRPDIVLYEENLSDYIIKKSINAISLADMLIIGGTSLLVYPADELIYYYSGHKLVVINKTPLELDRPIDLFIQGKIGEVLSQVILE